MFNSPNDAEGGKSTADRIAAALLSNPATRWAIIALMAILVFRLKDAQLLGALIEFF